MAIRLGPRLSSWRYEATPDGPGSRDLRIDLLRGFCLFAMIVDHVGGQSSWLYALTGGDRFVVSAAEVFVLLSGIALGMVHRTTIQRQGVRAMFAKLLRRAVLLYLVGAALTLAFASASVVLAAPWAARATPAQDEVDFALSVLTLHRTYSLTDILVLYTLLVLAAAPVLALIARGHGLLVLAGSVAVWAVAQLWPAYLPGVWVITDGGFPFAAWQLIFCVGLVVGYHRERLAAQLRPSRLLLLGATLTIAVFLIQRLVTDVGVDPRELLFDKNDARPGRVLALLAAASFGYAALTLGWVPVRRLLGWLLLALGRRSLFAYSVQLFVVAFFSSALMAPVRLDRENALFQASAVLIVWLACVATPELRLRTRTLARRVPSRAMASA
ncbi:MAG TPA: OpgC domain-containing protein [Candidatus Limnocylindria bacterium]|jgi:hypothetical protein|nr:OpgC domain-containing protein [Candidatus Limnocylindria bacterium]